MSKIGTNIIILLGIVTIVFGAYYFLTQEAALVLRSSDSDRQLEQLVRSSQIFVERSATLESIQMDTSVLSFDVFNSLKIYSPDPDEYGVRRTNPFVPTDSSDLIPIVIDEQ